jgi:hypothetical protein
VNKQYDLDFCMRAAHWVGSETLSDEIRTGFAYYNVYDFM